MAGSLVVPPLALAQQNARRLALYANVGPELFHYDVDVDAAVLTKRSSFKLPSVVQYAWPHETGRVLYVVSSNRRPGSRDHFLTALRLDPKTGEMRLHGDPVQLPERPIHVTTDLRSEHVLVAFNDPSSVRVYRVNGDMTVGSEIPQPGVTDGGHYAHQIRVTPDGRHAILVCRGDSATPKHPENPGALKMFDYDAGNLSNETSTAPNGGFGFGPRHLDFHPGKPWVYVSIERQSKLYVYRLERGRLAGEAAFIKDTVAEPNNMRPRQLAGGIHVHPNGRVVYVANRADATEDFKGKQVFVGGENIITVYAIDQTTGEPTAIQHADTRKAYPRTFHIDPSGRMMVVQHNSPINMRDGGDVRLVPAGMTVFRIEGDGKLTFQRVYDVEVGKESMVWMGLVQI
jgi:6-phosphogluconolactonase (cycloisomerase 2 family)